MTDTTTETDEIAARAFRDDISNQLDEVKHGGRRKLIHRHGKPAALVLPVDFAADVDAYLMTDRGLSHVSMQKGDRTWRVTRDDLAADLRKRSDQLRLVDAHVELRLVDVDVLSTLLAELAAARHDALATLADEWATRLHNIVADAE